MTVYNGQVRVPFHNTSIVPIIIRNFHKSQHFHNFNLIKSKVDKTLDWTFTAYPNYLTC